MEKDLDATPTGTGTSLPGTPVTTELENRDKVLSVAQSLPDGQIDEWVATSSAQLQVWKPGSARMPPWVSGPCADFRASGACWGLVLAGPGRSVPADCD